MHNDAPHTANRFALPLRAFVYTHTYQAPSTDASNMIFSYAHTSHLHTNIKTASRTRLTITDKYGQCRCVLMCVFSLCSIFGCVLCCVDRDIAHSTTKVTMVSVCDCLFRNTTGSASPRVADVGREGGEVNFRQCAAKMRVASIATQSRSRSQVLRTL